MLFSGISQWDRELICYNRLVGSEVLPFYRPSSHLLAAFDGPVVNMRWWRRKHKEKTMTSHCLSYLFLDPYVSIVVTV